MARYEQSYDGARRSSGLRVQLTPDERAALEVAAQKSGAASLSAFVRKLCVRRLAALERVAGTRRHPEAQKLIYELSAIGNNLNQLTRVANTTGEVPTATELLGTTALLKAAMTRVLAL